jgi:phage terminase small subunit
VITLGIGKQIKQKNLNAFRQEEDSGLFKKSMNARFTASAPQAPAEPEEDEFEAYLREIAKDAVPQ